MKDKITPIEVAKAFFEAEEWVGDDRLIANRSLIYGRRVTKELRKLERRYSTLTKLYEEIRKEIECINEIVKK
jgi:hypothetical protein